MTSLGKFRILSIDDDPEFHKVLNIKLKKHNVELICTESPEDFFNEFKKQRPDICFIDLNIGDYTSSGFQIIQAIRRKRGTNIPIIVLSKMNTSESINQALELGADDYLTKPIDDPVFYAKLERLLGLISDDSIKLEYAKVPPAYSGGHIMLNFEINKINEFGITLHCPYYIASGTPLVLKSDLWTEVIGVDQLPVLSIHQCRV